MQKLAVIGWLFLIALVSGLAMALAGKLFHAPLSIIHKLSAVLCFVFLLLRIVVAIRLFEPRPAILATIVVFAGAFIGAFVTGVVQSIPAQAGALWLNLHRAAVIVATIAFAAASRAIAHTMR